MKATRVEQQIIRKSHPLWKSIDENCFYSKNLYNYANYIVRQEFIDNNNYLNYYAIDKQIKDSVDYKNLMSQPAQCTLQMLDRNWKSFFAAIKDWSKNPSKYLGRPKLPKYLKKDGRYPWFIKNNSCEIQENGRLYFRVNRLRGYDFRTKAQGRLICVRFIPRGSVYVMEVITEVEARDMKDIESKRIASIDLGVRNFATMVNNIGQQPIIIKGGEVKSLNQNYNKKRAQLQAELKIRHNKHKSQKLDVLDYKRNNRIKNFLHTASKRIVEWCISNKIDTLVVGRNKGWKQETNIGKINNQVFVQIPHYKFISQLEYKCQNAGIKYIEVDESYTSGTSFLDGEFPNEENYNKTRRISRGLFKSKNRLINADVNGGLQIMKKAFPNVESNHGIEVACLQPLVHRDIYHKQVLEAQQSLKIDRTPIRSTGETI